MSQDGLYDWIAHQDCLPREGDNFELDAHGEALATLAEWSDEAVIPIGVAWLDEMVERRDNAREALLRAKLQVPAGEDLLHAALTEQFVRDRYNMHPLVIE